ncbi:MAG: hypothetical protein EOP49_07455 [Sphingobacteriales bacterium]|nr:MAG: hypothetical protein EOP49_07455 [Sphingobacteriales bacterium]
MMNRGIEDIEALLFRYLTDEVTVAEKMQVEQWVAASEDNRMYFESLQTIWNVSLPQELPGKGNPEAAWEKLRASSVSAPPRRIPLGWLKTAAIAAGVALLAGATGYFANQTKQPHTQAAATIPNGSVTNPVYKTSEAVPVEVPSLIAATQAPAQAGKGLKMKKPPVRQVRQDAGLMAVTEQKNVPLIPLSEMKKEQICNNTPCPIEICIKQSFFCDGKKETMTAYCSILEPDMSGQVHYNSTDPAMSCLGSIDEIRITRVSTGETIVLNEHSDVKARDFFNYLTGEKQGGIEAGRFESDCDNLCMNHTIKLDNSLGDLVLQ